MVVFNGNSSNKGINIVSISLNLDIEKTKVFLSILNLPHPPKVYFIYSRAFRLSWCKAILNTNSNPDTSFFSFLIILIKKFDSASQRPTNHLIKLLILLSSSVHSYFDFFLSALILQQLSVFYPESYLQLYINQQNQELSPRRLDIFEKLE